MFGAHAPGQGYFGQGPQGGTNPVVVLFRAAYRLALWLRGARRTLQPAANRRRLGGIATSRTVIASGTRRTIGPVTGARVLGPATV